MPNVQAVDRVVAILADRAYGPGLTIADLRRHYPAKDVRRVTLLLTLAHLERLGLVRWRDGRAWWTGPIPPRSRPLGIPAHRVTRHETTSPAERVQAWLRLQRMTKSMAATRR
jgi:hypothetical protein